MTPKPSKSAKKHRYLSVDEPACQEYGFIVQLPDGRVGITGIMYEPWHFRYVGVEAATYIMEKRPLL